MIRGSGLRGSNLREDEDVQPMQYVANLTDVMLVYVICEHLGFSGVIASVVCGMCFAYMRNRAARKLMVQDPVPGRSRKCGYAGGSDTKR